MAEYKSRHTGAEIDAGIDKANAALARSGGTMTGELILSGDPVSDKAAATRQYVDQAVRNIALIPGEDGATFTPSVSADGVLTWTNDAGLPNPPQVSVRGPRGDDGISPTIAVEEIQGGHSLTVTDASGSRSFNVMDGEDGGVTSWNDLTDRPFGVETRTKILTGEVNPDADNGVAHWESPLKAVPVAGAKYRVRWANSYYDCTGIEMPTGDGGTSIALGNIDAMTGTGNSGEPFVILLIPNAAENASSAEIYCLDSDYFGYIVALDIEMIEVSKIPEELMPDTPGIMFVDVSGVVSNSISGWTTETSFMDAFAAVTSGNMVFLRVTDPDDPNLMVIIPCGGVDGNAGMIRFVHPAGTTNNYIFGWSADGSFANIITN